MSFGKLSDRHRRVLAHIARYRFTFKEVLSSLYFDGADPQKTLDGLRDEGYITARKLFKGNRSAYQLEAKGAAALGVSRRRAEGLGAEALATHLAIFSFCHLKGFPRIRLEEDEVASLFDEHAPPGRYHCLERSTRSTRVFHVYVPGDGTKAADVVAMTRSHIAEVIQTPGMLPWLANLVYSHAILVESHERAELLVKAVNSATFDDRIPLREVTHVRVECVPGFNNLEEGLHALA
ncbi:MAG: hypothetical protein DCC65_07890 [Planctomycetota bacterium]|nr:MAG: hypothetical protein DCC65_07890 [Planctomycetota bacterium]